MEIGFVRLALHDRSMNLQTSPSVQTMKTTSSADPLPPKAEEEITLVAPRAVVKKTILLDDDEPLVDTTEKLQLKSKKTDRAKKKQEKREAGLQSARSRSSSRRARRNRLEKDLKDGKYMHTTSLEVLEEADANGDLQKMGMFERIGPDSTSMDGPVTHARAMRGEIPMRGTNPNEPKWANPEKSKSSLQDEDGLKLTLEANLEIEIELKASIRGDLTLSL